MRNVPLAILVASLFSGCASQEYVDGRIATLEKMISELKASTEAQSATAAKQTGDRFAAVEHRNTEQDILLAQQHKQLTQLEVAVAKAHTSGETARSEAQAAADASKAAEGRIAKLEDRAQTAVEQSQTALERANTATDNFRALAATVASTSAAPAAKPDTPAQAAAQAVGETRQADEAGRMVHIEDSVAGQSKRIAEMEGQLSATTRTAQTALEQGQQLDVRLKQSESLYSELRQGLVAQQERLARQEVMLQEVSRTAQEALERAQTAGKLAQGKLLYEVTLTEDDIHFPFDRYDLSPGCCNVLDQLATRLKADNQGVYLEIQGHTDNVGATLYNMNLGMARADGVRRYLHDQAGIPLHRMSVVSYGETRPLTDNKTREGRKLNRRVVIVVLR